MVSASSSRAHATVSSHPSVSEERPQKGRGIVLESESELEVHDSNEVAPVFVTRNFRWGAVGTLFAGLIAVPWQKVSLIHFQALAGLLAAVVLAHVMAKRPFGKLAGGVAIAVAAAGVAWASGSALAGGILLPLIIVLARIRHPVAWGLTSVTAVLAFLASGDFLVVGQWVGLSTLASLALWPRILDPKVELAAQEDVALNPLDDLEDLSTSRDTNYVFSLGDVVDRCVRALEFRHADREIQIHSNGLDELDPYFEGDEDLVETVVRGVLAEAVVSTMHRGHINLHVIADARNRVRFSIEFETKSLSKRDLARKLAEEPQDGLLLTLAHCRTMVEQHNGTMGTFVSPFRRFPTVLGIWFDIPFKKALPFSQTEPPGAASVRSHASSSSLHRVLSHH